MIDTVRVKLAPCSWRPYAEIDNGWDIRESDTQTRKWQRTTAESVENAESGLLLNHRESGLRVGGTAENPKWMEVSLPKLYKGKNGILLENDKDISGAFIAAYEKCLEVIMPGARVSFFTELFVAISRLDLCWQFEGDIDAWVQAFRLQGHPNVRRPTVTHAGSGLVFPGVGLHIRIYDKRKEQVRRKGDVVRVECQLRNPKLKEYGLAGFDESFLGGFARLWSIFKDIVYKFNPGDLHQVSNLAELLALLEADNVRVGEQSPFEIWAAGKHRSSVSRMRRMMRDALPCKVGIDLWELCAVPIPVHMTEGK